MVSFAAATRLARSVLKEDAGRLWGKSFADVGWLGFEGDRIHLTADPDQPVYLPSEPGVWTGPLPDGVIPTCSPIDWAGRRWSGIILPLTDGSDTLRLLLHEACHAVQAELLPKLPALATEAATGDDLLDTAEGRVWLRLEVDALGRALQALGSDADWRGDAADALLFRRRRLTVATPQEADRERLLDVWEGMAEYTGWRLSGASPRALAAHVVGLPEGERASWVRWFPYHTGPAYAYLLDAAGPDWRTSLREQSDRPDLQTLLAPAVPAYDVHTAETRAAGHGLDHLRERENVRAQHRQGRIDTLAERFGSPQVLRIRPTRMQVVFDPGRVTPLGFGAVHESLAWRTSDGAELAASEAMITADWKEIRLATGPETFPTREPVTPVTLVGPGWTLRLTAAWQVLPAGDGWCVEPASQS